MCDPCREKYAKTKDVERACDRPGCSGTWTWTVAQQMEAFATKRPPPAGPVRRRRGRSWPRSPTRPIPCAVPGCTRTSVFSRRAQLLAGAPDVEPPLPTQRCGQCEGVFRKLKDRPVRCGINGCDNKWTWPALRADRGLRARAAQRSAAPDVRRVQGRLRRDRRPRGPLPHLGLQEDLDLDARRSAGRVPRRASRRPRRRTACARAATASTGRCRTSSGPAAAPAARATWIDKRGGQLARAVRGKTGDPYPQYCEDCSKNIVELEDRQVAVQDRQLHRHLDLDQGGAARGGRAARAEAKEPEAAEAAAATSTVDRRRGAPPRWRRACCPRRPWRRRRARSKKKAQARAIKPPERRCEDCSDFLKDKKTLEIPCKQCATPIYWPPESQLQTHLGAWAEPAMCGACKRDAMEAARTAEREALRNAHPGPGERGAARRVGRAAAADEPAAPSRRRANALGTPRASLRASG